MNGGQGLKREGERERRLSELEIVAGRCKEHDTVSITRKCALIDYVKSGEMYINNSLKNNRTDT